MTDLLELPTAASSPLTQRVMQPRFVSVDEALRDSVKVYHGFYSKRKFAGDLVVLVLLFMAGYSLLINRTPKGTDFNVTGAGLMLVSAAGIAYVVYELRRKKRIFILEDALAIERRFSSEVELIQWTDVAKLYCVDRTTRTQFYVLYFIPVGHSDYHRGWIKMTLGDGRQVAISNRVRDFSGMAQQIVCRTTAVQLMPCTQIVIEEGGTLDFDKFGLSNDGLVYKGKLIAWSDIQRVSLSHRGSLLFRTASRWRSPRFSLETIPNASLLLEMLPIFGVQVCARVLELSGRSIGSGA